MILAAFLIGVPLGWAACEALDRVFDFWERIE